MVTLSAFPYLPVSLVMVCLQRLDLRVVCCSISHVLYP